MIILHSTDCPLCKVLKKKLDSKKIIYETNNDVNIMLKLGIVNVPVLEVDGKLLGFQEANKWINER